VRIAQGGAARGRDLEAHQLGHWRLLAEVDQRKRAKPQRQGGRDDPGKLA
jgi:hypothetical protein